MPLLTETPGFVPISQWPTLHDLCDGFSAHLPPDSPRLSGRRLELVLLDGCHIEHHFINTETLVWTITEGSDHVGLHDEAHYRAFEVRPDIFFIDFYKTAYEEQVSIVLNVSNGQAVIAISGFEDIGEIRRTRTTFSDARIKDFESAKPYEPTEELVGKHILYRYTGEDAYEHIYLNGGTYTWHCVSGTEKGLADTEPCKVLKLDEKLYLLFWTEKIMPVESVVVVDLKQMRSTGRFFCWDPIPNKPVRTLFGSYATLLADTNARKYIQ